MTPKISFKWAKKCTASNKLRSFQASAYKLHTIKTAFDFFKEKEQWGSAYTHPKISNTRQMAKTKKKLTINMGCLQC